MSEDLKTIRELADELGVSKNKIHYQVSKIPSEYIVRNNSMKLLTAEAIKQIKENLGVELNSGLNSKLNTVKHQNNTNIKGNLSVEDVELNSTLNSYLNSLKHQIEYLESQNINKDEQIKSLVEAQKQTQNLLDCHFPPCTLLATFYLVRLNVVAGLTNFAFAFEIPTIVY